MSNSSMPLEDREELLSAWLDRELESDPEAQACAQALVEGDPEAAARARQWAADGEALRAALAPALEEPVPPALQQLVWRRRSAPRWALAASALALLVVGGLVGSALTLRRERHDPQLAAGTAAGWVERAAYAHSVFTPEPRHAVEVKAQEEHLSRWLTNRIALPVKLFDLRAQGFELVGGRLLPDGPGKSAQLMYQNAAGTRVTVYLRKPEAGADAAFRYERHGELGLFYWVESGAGYALVGALPREDLLALAEAIYRQKPEMPGAASAPAS
ncbi:MAG: anti-sigma factor [Rubrivivax sp.]